MKPKLSTLMLLALTLATIQLLAAPLGTSFTYQGRLTDGDNPANGIYDLRFAIYDSTNNPGAVIAGPLTNAATAVNNGLFTITLDFGPNAFDGTAHWLEIAVRPGGSTGTFTPLNPRQPLTPAPYALYALTPAGPEGPQGPAGPQGAQGLQGPQGAAGPAGPTGSQGQPGPIGATGPQGPQGPTGTAGPAGPSGPKGLNWLGAWNNASNYGADDAVFFNGSAWTAKRANTNVSPVEGADWTTLAQQGESGPTGAQGPAGPQGPVGAIGPQGPAGSVGPQGPQGPVGLTGPQGAQGPVGPQGPPGSADAWSLTGNTGTDSSVNFIGTTDNQPLEFKVNGRRALRLEPTTDVDHSNSVNVIGGSPLNFIRRPEAYGATIAGGGGNSSSNTVTHPFGTVGGGAGNTSAGTGATIGGGEDNSSSSGYATVGGGYNNTSDGTFSTIGGGYRNDSSSFAATVGGGYSNASGDYGTVGGGENNRTLRSYGTVGGGAANTSFKYATVGGGVGNTSSGYGATVPGGIANTAAETNSFAAGYRANANHPGTFVWADYSQDAEFASTTNNQFLIRASGGVGIGTNAPSAMLQVGSATCDGTTWANASDRALKENFQPINPMEILASVAQLSVSRWNYKSAPGDEHIGPVAQDFQTAFGLGADDKRISTVDEGGVALAAIQGLNELVQEKDARIAALEARVSALEQQHPGSASAPHTGPSPELLLMAGMFGLNLTLGALVVVYARMAQRA